MKTKGSNKSHNGIINVERFAAALFLHFSLYLGNDFERVKSVLLTGRSNYIFITIINIRRAMSD